MARAAGAVGATVIAVSLLCAPVAMAGPRPGERYDGRIATGQRISLTVRADGSRLQHYDFTVQTRCSDGKRRIQSLFPDGEGPASIDAAGRFAYRSAAQPGVYYGLRGRLRLSFSGVFDATGDSVSGTIRGTFRSKRLDCSSGPVPYTMHRNGSAAAPWRNSLMASGLYLARGRGVTMRMRTLAPGPELVRGTIRYRAPCGAARSLSLGTRFLRYPISDSGRLRAGGRISQRLRGERLTVRARFRLRLRFFAGTRVSGVWTLRATLVGGGRVVDTCRMRRSLRGSFERGPA